MTQQRPNARARAVEEIARALRVFVPAGDVTELRVPQAPHAGTISGYFDDPDKAATAAARLSGRVPAIYFLLNRVSPALLARACNRMVEWAKTTTNDGDVVRRRWFLLDFDPARPSGISATNDEHNAALAKAETVRAWLAGCGWPEPVYADSGNGGHLQYALDLPNDRAATDLLGRCLRALDLLFGDEAVQVDKTTANAARVCKLYGTVSGKGDSVPDRPHRVSRLLRVPPRLDPVPAAKLEALAARLPPEPAKGAAKGGDGDFDMGRWLQAHNVAVAREGAWEGAGYRWVLKECPWNSDHTNQSAYVVRLPGGGFAAGCHHNGCSDKQWADLRELHEPGYKARKAAAEAGAKPSSNGHGPAPGAQAADKPEAVWVTLDQVRVEPVTWLWRGRIPHGAVSLLDGDPDQGKSTLAVDLAARVTRGQPMPGKEREPGDDLEPAGVMLLSAEDDLGRTIKPRFLAAGGNESRAVFLKGIRLGDDERQPVLPLDLGVMEGLMAKKGVRLVIVDPLMAYLDSEINAHVDADVRRAMHQLKLLAERTGAAILVIRHLNKLDGSPALYRGGGSIGIIGACRSALVVGRHPGKPDTYVLAVNKCNLAARAASLTYSLEPAAGDVCRIAWGEECDLGPDDILAHPGRKPAGDRCAMALAKLLANGPRKAADLEKDLKAEGHSDYAIKAARKRLGVKPIKSSFDGSWWWQLPGSTAESEPGAGGGAGASP
jgi:hypothetical protein